MKNYPAAIETYHTLIEELPFELFVVGDAQFRIGQLYQELGEFDKAVEAYQTLMKRWPQSFRRDEAVYNMAICYETMQDYKNAYEYYKIYVSFGDKTEFFRAAEQKMRQYEYDEDGDGFSFWREQQADTSDQDKNSYPGAKVLKPKR